ncbi:transient receptor potential cation channel subfamily a member 1-like [Gigaspora margarita]|uniref:Transient receptor potential cation channel subfamily a member 1-like n=2 Tax=Gigaspora margarita TaxID=4874 RepID=A0A8H3WWH8_GIGMA|nr:transient receptor potential cation channel subfamily a member 1-like [Gigaspora margarita]
MASISDNSQVKVQIDPNTIEETLDKNTTKNILEIVCSPEMKYIAALSKEKDISLWSIVNEEQYLKYEKEIFIDAACTESEDSRLFAVSDNMHVSIKLDKDRISRNSYNCSFYSLITNKEVFLRFPDRQKEIDFLSFINNGNLVMVNARNYRAYVFSCSRKDNTTWTCISMIELKYFKKVYITPKGSFIIYNDMIHEITIWDIETLSIKTHVLIDWGYILETIGFSEDEELLLVHAREKKKIKNHFYVFSTKFWMNLAYCEIEEIIDGFHLIASNKGERLLIITQDPTHKKKCFLMDPYILKERIDADKLFQDDDSNQTKIPSKPYIIKFDKIIYTIDGKLFIKELVHDNWINYLRKDLKDINSITAPSKKTIEIMKNGLNMGNDKYILAKELQGLLFQWKLNCKPESIVLEAKDDKVTWKLDILPSFYTNGNKFILQCDLLENDDLIMTTRIGIFVWSVKYKLKQKGKEIRMLYFWNNCNLKGWNGNLEKFNLEKAEKDELFNNNDSERFLPVSSYEIVYKNLDIVFGKEKLFLKFLGDNIDDEFYLTCYGNDLMKTFIKLNDDFWVRDCGRGCLKPILKNKNLLISKISLLKIIFEKFTELSEEHPTYITSLLTNIAFVLPTDTPNLQSTTKHLSSYGTYCHLSRTSFLDIYKPNISWNNFKKYFVNLFKNSSHSSIKLVIPLPNFVTYPKDYKFWKELLLPESSCFAGSPYNEMINYELYKYINIEALLEFKWNTYGRMYYFAIWTIYTIFLCSFTIAATLSRNISQDNLYFLLYLTIFLGIWHLVFELRQFVYHPMLYISSAWNFFDLGAYIFPTISSFLWLQNGSISISIIAISTLLLEIKFLLFFRVIEFSGTHFSMILGVAKSAFSFLMILGFIVFAFAHSLYLLLHSDISDNETEEYASFTTISGALLSVYIMLTGNQNLYCKLIYNH